LGELSSRGGGRERGREGEREGEGGREREGGREAIETTDLKNGATELTELHGVDLPDGLYGPALGARFARARV
jgi:hypothetical protein